MRLTKPQQFFITCFAVVLFIRAFGLLGLFQHAPLGEGLGSDRLTSKKVNYAKNDPASDVVYGGASNEYFELVSGVPQGPHGIFKKANDYSRSLRSPPLQHFLIEGYPRF